MTSTPRGSSAPTTASQGSVPVDSFRTRWPIGDVLARVIVPLWVTVGALMKLEARDPRLLPEPIVDLVRTVAVAFMEERNQAWLLDSTLRLLIGIELALVVAMVFVPRISRLVASFTLIVFLLVLAETMRLQVLSDGFMAMITGSCGCLGAKSPPPPVMFLIDAVLLVGVLLFPLRWRLGQNSLRLVPLTLLLGSIAAFTIAMLTPPKPMRIVIPDDLEESSLDGSSTVAPDGGTVDPTVSNGVPASHWPAPPEISPMYFPQVGSWVGRRMSEIDLLQQMRPAPAAELLEGISYIVIYRGDCGNCHDLLAIHMSDDRAPRTIVLRVAEGDPAADKPMPSDRFRMHALPEGPTYVLTTPVLAVVRDGVIRAASAGVDLETAQAMLSSVEDEVPSAPVSGMPAAEQPTPPATTPPATTPPASTPAGSPAGAATPAPAAGNAWPARPDVEGMYFPQFEQWIGLRLDQQPLALQINRPMPVNEGRWHLLFYRADCDQCHEMMDIYLVGELEPRVIAVRIPDTDPAGDLPMPLSNALFRSLPEGPTYVVQAPVLLTIVDGVVRCMATDPMDQESVLGCLDAK